LRLQTGSRFKPDPFAEVLCTGVQRIRISCAQRCDASQAFAFSTLRVYLFHGEQEWPQEMMPADIIKLAHNDGLTTEDFIRWFTLDQILHGSGFYQIIHWTDLRY
jgi:hypothetical protein